MSMVKHIILAIVLLYVQVLFAPKLTLFGIVPNLIFPLIVLAGISFSKNIAISIAFFTGLALDLLNPSQLGLNTISMLIIAQLSFEYNKNINKERIVMVFLTLLLLSLIYELPFLLYNLFIPGTGSFVFLKSMIVVLYNGVASLLLVYLYYLFTRLKFYLDM